MKLNGTTRPCCYRLLILIGLLPFLAVVARAQGGATVAQANLAYLVQHAHTIVHGNVVSSVLEPDPQFSNLETVLVTVQVAKTLKGPAQAKLTFRQYVWNTKDPIGAGSYHKAEEVVLFLNPVSEYGLTSPVGMEQGLFRVLRDNKGNRFAVNGRGNIGLFSGILSNSETRKLNFSAQAKAMLSKTAGVVPLDSLEETIQTLAAVRQ